MDVVAYLRIIIPKELQWEFLARTWVMRLLAPGGTSARAWMMAEGGNVVAETRGSNQPHK